MPHSHPPVTPSPWPVAPPPSFARPAPKPPAKTVMAKGTPKAQA